MLDRTWERELLTAGSALPLHDLRNVVLVLVLPLALLAVVRDMLPGRIVEDRLSTCPAGFLQELGFFLDRHGCHGFGFPGKDIFQPVEHSSSSVLQFPIIIKEGPSHHLTLVRWDWIGGNVLFFYNPMTSATNSFIVKLSISLKTIYSSSCLFFGKT